MTDRPIARPNFKDSPFYTVLEPLTSVLECKGMCSMILVGVTLSFDFCATHKSQSGRRREIM